jgi:hypothetical protein
MEVRAAPRDVKQRSRRSNSDDTDNPTKRDRSFLVTVALMKE